MKSSTISETCAVPFSQIYSDSDEVCFATRCEIIIFLVAKTINMMPLLWHCAYNWNAWTSSDKKHFLLLCFLLRSGSNSEVHHPGKKQNKTGAEAVWLCLQPSHIYITTALGNLSTDCALCVRHQKKQKYPNYLMQLVSCFHCHQLSADSAFYPADLQASIASE